MRKFYRQCKSYLLRFEDLFLFVFLVFAFFSVLLPFFVFQSILLFHIDGSPSSPLPQPLRDDAVLLKSSKQYPET
jgi:hypothetical protein